MTAKPPIRHLALYPGGASPLSPWHTACGREVPERQCASQPADVTCRTCTRTLGGHEVMVEHRVQALHLQATPAATRGTVACDQHEGPTALVLAVQARLPPQVLVDLQARAALGRDRYGVELRSPWRQGLHEALPELLDAVAYLLVSDHPEARPLVRKLVPLVQQLQMLSRGLPA